MDLNSTYVGCSNACRDEPLALEVEALEIDPATGITNRSDVRNGTAK